MAQRAAVFLSNSPCVEEQPWYTRSITCRLAYLTDYTPDWINASLHLLEKLYHPSQEFVKWDIKLRDLGPRARPRRNLFDDRNQIRNVRLMKAVDYTMPTTEPGPFTSEILATCAVASRNGRCARS